jgi:CO dehydrogenase/acetyl-CoA synthase alpha subunit
MSDLSQPEEATVTTFTDDIAIMAVGGSVEETTEKLQRAVDKVNNWTSQRLVKLNEAMSVYVDFTNKRCQHIPILIKKNKVIPYSNTAKYLGMTLDAKLCWKTRLKKKHEELGLT